MKKSPAELNSAPTYTILPSLRQPENVSQAPLHTAVGKILEILSGYRPFDRISSGGVSSPDRPDLFVIIPRDGDPSVDERKILNFLEPLKKLSGSRILYIDPRIPLGNQRMEPLQSAGNTLSFNLLVDIRRLFEWLNDGETPVERKFENPEQIVDLAAEILFGKKNDDIRQKMIEIAENTLLKRDECSGSNKIEWWEALYVLMCVSAKFDQLDHDLGKQERHPLDYPDHKYPSLCKNHAVLTAATDLLHSIRKAGVFQADSKGSGPDNRQEADGRKKDEFSGERAILLLDDKPSEIETELRKLLNVFLPGYKLWIWQASHHNSQLLEQMRQYNSLLGTESLENYDTAKDIIRELGEDGKSHTIKTNLMEAVQRAQFVLVDLLFKVGGMDEDCGTEIIRGLRRLCTDEGGSRALGGNRTRRPHFIAFSRSADIKKIQLALKAGACGYVLKNRLLGLPGVLAELRFPTEEITGTLHRNFNSLQQLPNETRGMLQAIRIPEEPFHRPGKTDLDGVNLLPIARLLRAIPKTDLHLHVGSCMTPEFLIAAAAIELSGPAENNQKQGGGDRTQSAENLNKKSISPIEALKPLFGFWSGRDWELDLSLAGKSITLVFQLEEAISKNSDPVNALGDDVRNFIKSFSEKMSKPDSHTGDLRSILHKQLGIRDHWPSRQVEDRLDSTNAVDLMLFALLNGRLRRKDEGVEGNPPIKLDKTNILRLFILFLAGRYPEPVIRLAERDLAGPLRVLSGAEKGEFVESLNGLQSSLAAISEAVKRAEKRLNERRVEGGSGGRYGRDLNDLCPVEINLNIQHHEPLRDCPEFLNSPLEYLLASGTRSNTLAGYLAGCEYSGAEHLRRYFLMFLYAKQTLEYLVSHGVFYAELRAAASGYVNEETGFTFRKAFSFLQEMFEEEQGRLLELYHQFTNDGKAGEANTSRIGNRESGWNWCSGRTGKEQRNLFDFIASTRGFKPFPAKVNLVLTGKRHKATREMLTEAAAGVILSSGPRSGTITARDFSDKEMAACHVAGFDLAGLEESFPPEMFRAQFEQLSRMHIPITAHAGENASVRFVESAVLDLRARRIGHGLALADDKRLMCRVREDQICIELCPISNYQTNRFIEKESKTGDEGNRGRRYPLMDFLENGNAICLNTDNPIISFTNIIKEFFQASYALGERRLTLWEALRWIRAGFIHAFMSLPERQAIMNLVDQLLFDYLTDPRVISSLEEIIQEQEQLE